MLRKILLRFSENLQKNPAEIAPEASSVISPKNPSEISPGVPSPILPKTLPKIWSIFYSGIAEEMLSVISQKILSVHLSLIAWKCLSMNFCRSLCRSYCHIFTEFRVVVLVGIFYERRKFKNPYRFLQKFFWEISGQSSIFFSEKKMFFFQNLWNSLKISPKIPLQNPSNLQNFFQGFFRKCSKNISDIPQEISPGIYIRIAP